MFEQLRNEAEVGIEQHALDLMRQERPQLEDEQQAAARRARLLPNVIQYVERAPQRRSRRTLVAYGSGIALAAAAAVALWLSPGLLKSESNLVASSNQGDFWLLRGEQQETVRTGHTAQLEVDDQVRTPATSSASLTLPTGSNVQVNESSTVQIAQLNPGNYETLRLLGGSVKVHVPKLKAGEYFAVLTETSKVVVHGTRFSVDVSERATPGATCVTVTEGLVAVHTAEQVHWVGVGESWGCKASPAKAPSSPVANPVVDEAGQPAAPVTAPNRSLGNSSNDQPEIARLAEQNRLFQRALTHQRREEWGSARGAYEELLKRFPDAPVASEARVQLRKIRDKITAEQ